METQLALADLNNGVFSSAIVAKIKEKRTELDRLLALEEYYWHQRSRSEWVQGGDRNTKFFSFKGVGSPA